MTEIRFYHLERQTVDQALPALISRALEGGHRIVVKAANEKEVARLNDHLWTYDPGSFLPHGSKKDGVPEAQPVWLTSEDENPNNANVLIIVQGANSNIQGDFSMCCEIFDGHNQEAVLEARQHWKSYKEAGLQLTYWQQGATGWEQKNTTKGKDE